MSIPINIKTHRGYYWQAEEGGGRGLSGKGPWPREWETFWVTPVKTPSAQYLSHGTKVWILSDSGHYVQASNGGGSSVNCSGPWGKEWETFTVIAPPGKEGLAISNGSAFGLRTHTGHFLCAENGGGREITANRTEMKEWETFYAEIPEEPRLYMSLRTHDGCHYLQAQDGGGGTLTAKGPWARQWETFEVLRGDPLPESMGDGFHVHLRSENGRFFQVPETDGPVSASAVTCADRRKTWFMMEFPDEPDMPIGTGRLVRLRTFHGKYISALSGGGSSVQVRKGTPGDYETFHAEVRTGPSFLAPKSDRQYGWILIRDTIRINDQFVSILRREAAARKLSPGANILLIARNVIHDPGYVLKVWEFNLTVVAETYDANGGKLVLTPPAIAQIGPDGTAGRKGEADWLYGVPGGPGGVGTEGFPGTASFGVHMLCRSVKDVNIDCRGGQGGRGAKGGVGGNGGDVGYAPTVGGGRGPTAYGSSGGNGGKGGTGGRGGNGGQVMLYFAGGTVSQILAQGGAGGTGGEGGDPGIKSGDEEFLGSQHDNYPYGNWAQLRTPHNGAKGQKGDDGSSGSAAKVIRSKLAETDFFERVRSTLGEHAKAWAALRSRTGDYLQRTYVPSDKSTLVNLELAMDEAVASALLNIEDVGAHELKDRLRLNQTPTGLARDYDVIPDFGRFEDFVTRYYDMVAGLFESVTFLLANSSNLGAVTDRLRNETRHALASVDILNSDLAALDIDKTDLEEQIKRIIVKAGKLEEELTARISVLQDIHLFIEDGLSLETVGLVIDVVAAIVAVVKSGQGVYTAVSSAMDLIVKIGSSLADDTKGGHPDYQDDVAAAAGKLGDLAKNGKELISKAKVLLDLMNAKTDSIDDELSKKVIDLTKQSAELAFERGRAELRLSQVMHQRGAVLARKQQAQADADGLSRQTMEISGDFAVYAKVIPSLLRVGRGYADLLMKHVFLAARAADTYTFQTASGGMSFDYGFAHPDVEESALDALRRGDSRGVVELVASLLTSWNKLPEIMRYADMVRDYEDNLRSEVMYHYPLQDASKLDSFKATGEVEFTIPLSALLPGRIEAKIESVQVALVGATSPDPSILCRLEHSGQAWIRMADGTEAEVVALPREASVQAWLLPLAGLDPSQGNLVAAYWGRSPTAVWRLWIEPAVFERIDLANLTQVQMRIGYRARVL